MTSNTFSPVKYNSYCIHTIQYCRTYQKVLQMLYLNLYCLLNQYWTFQNYSIPYKWPILKRHWSIRILISDVEQVGSNTVSLVSLLPVTPRSMRSRLRHPRRDLCGPVSDKSHVSAPNPILSSPEIKETRRSEATRRPSCLPRVSMATAAGTSPRATHQQGKKQRSLSSVCEVTTDSVAAHWRGQTSPVEDQLLFSDWKTRRESDASDCVWGWNLKQNEWRNILMYGWLDNKHKCTIQSDQHSSKDTLSL